MITLLSVCCEKGSAVQERMFCFMDRTVMQDTQIGQT